MYAVEIRAAEVWLLSWTRVGYGKVHVMARGKSSAGLLACRERGLGLEVLLVHPGGPFWARRDDGAWSIPKGEIADGEEALAAARREFAEELGREIDGEFVELTPIRQRGGKLVHAWAVRADFDASGFESSRFSMEWPPGSGRMQSFPEIDRAEWFPIEIARRKILDGQVPLLDEVETLGSG